MQDARAAVQWLAWGHTVEAHSSGVRGAVEDACMQATVGSLMEWKELVYTVGLYCSGTAI